MTTTKDLYDDFWDALVKGWGAPSPLVGSPLKAVHAASDKPKPYFDFDCDLGNGFRATAAISVQKNRVCAQLSSDKRGRWIVEELRKNHPVAGSPIEPYIRYFVSASDAKVELIWEDAMIADRRIWPVHQRWLRQSLDELARLFKDKIAD